MDQHEGDDQAMDNDPGGQIQQEEEEEEGTEDALRAIFGEDESIEGEESYLSLLPLPLEGGGMDAASGAQPLHLLPCDMVVNVASFLNREQLKNMRLTCRALCRAVELSRLSLSLATVPADSSAYASLDPTWLDEVKHVQLVEPVTSRSQRMGKPWYSFPVGCSPVCLWLLMFGPRLTNLTSVSLRYLPYLLEAIFVLKAACHGIRSLEVLKSPLHDFSMEAFWAAVGSLPNLKRLMFQGWSLGLPDLHGLEALTGLEELHIKLCSNHPTGLHCLSSLTNLRSITLEEIEYPGAIAQEFCGLSRLTKMECMRFVTVGPLADEIEALCFLTRLKTLEISQHYDDTLLPALYTLLSSISTLETLTLPQFELSDVLAGHLARQPHLRSLSVGRCRLTSTSLSQGQRVQGPWSNTIHVSQEGELSWSQVPGSSPAAGAAAGLAPGHEVGPSLPCVIRLSLRCQEPVAAHQQQQQQQDPPIPLSAVLAGLQQLRLLPSYLSQGEGILDRAAELFSEKLPLVHLTSLTAFAPLMAARPIVLGCPHIRTLVLECCYTVRVAPWLEVPEPQAAPVPAVHGGAAAVDVEVDPVADSGSSLPGWLQHLQLLPELCHVQLDDCLGMRDEDCEQLAAVLPCSTNGLKLSGCPRVGDKGLAALARLPNLRSLTISLALDITAKGIIQLLQQCPTLRLLDLDGCSPVNPSQCNMVLQRFIASGRRDLDIICSGAQEAL